MIEAQNLSFRYGEKDVLRGVSITLQSGEWALLEGPSGTGKTTFAHILAGHIPPIEGRVLVEGEEITGRPSRRVFVVSQTIDLFPWQTVREHIDFALQTGKPANSDHRVSCEKWLEMTDLISAQSKYPRELSGGMQKRLALARALAIDPNVLILDEVFEAQDRPLRDELLSRLKPHWKERGTTLIFISHDRGFWLDQCERVLSLQESRLSTNRS